MRSVQEGRDVVSRWPSSPPSRLHALIDEIYRTESRRVFASLVRLISDRTRPDGGADPWRR